MNDGSPTASRPLWPRLAGWILAIAGAVLLAYGIAAVAVPLLVSKLVLPRLGESLGRQVDVQSVRFNPFTLVLSAKALRIAAADPAAEFVTVTAVRTDLSISSLRHLAPVIDGLEIEHPIVHLQRTGTDRFNFSDIVERLRAQPAEPDTDRSPPRFALHNVVLTGGEILLDDEVLKQKHQVTELSVALPFVSNLDYATAIAVEPALSARVNGSPLSVTGTSRPFSVSRETTLDVTVKDVDIGRYLSLAPVQLGIAVPKGLLGTSLRVRFALQEGANRLTITGSSTIDDLQIDARQGPRLAQAKRVSVALDHVEPLAGRYALGELQVQGLSVELVRASDGSFPIVRAFVPRPQPSAAPRAAAEPAPAGPAAPEPSMATPSSASQALHWSIGKTTVRGGRVAYRDAAVAPPVSLEHTDIQVDLAEIGNRQARPADGKLSLKQNGVNQLSWAGWLDLAQSRASGKLDATVASAAPYLPYFAASIPGSFTTGALAARGQLQMSWAQAFSLEVADGAASVENAALVLPQETAPVITFDRLAADGVAFSLASRRLAIGTVGLGGARVQVQRDAAGTLNLQRLASVDATTAGATQGQTSPPAPASDRPGWSVAVGRVDLAGTGVTWRDLAGKSPVEVPVTDIAGSIERLGTDLSVASTIDLKARLGGTGTLTARGDVVVSPWSLELAVQLQQLGLAAFDPYLADVLTLSLDEGFLSSQGDLRLGGDRVAYRGRIEVDGLRSQERATSAQTLRWKKLLLDDVDVDVSSIDPGPKDHIVVGAMTLSEFFARVLLDEKGRFNLQDVVQADAAEAVEPGAQVGPLEAIEPVESASSAGPAIRLGTVKLERGRASFTDRYVQPNYSVNLTDLNGSLSPMASDAPAPSSVMLTGRVDGSAAMDISGQVNPFGASLSADLRAQANGIDLPTLTPYAAKYAGYTIEKGTLSLDVRYRIENGRLEAQNRVVLDQLTLGEKVDSPNAISLPIQFALGLLKNRNGEIDVSLPISGSLNDPQFSIGGIIGSAIVNLLTRLVTSPFSVLASAFGSRTAELSFVEFRGGTAELTAEAIDRLRTMSKALAERPALKLEIAGRVDPKAEQDAMRRQRLDVRLKALKRRQASGGDAAAGGALADATPRAGSSRDAQEADTADGQQRQAQVRQEEAAIATGVVVSAEEYPALLKRLYDDTAMPDKPRDAVGTPTRQEVTEMETLLLNSIAVDSQSARRLATRRSQVVRQWLATQGGVAEQRMFMLAPRTGPEMKGPDQAKPQCLASCAEFSLR